MNFYALKSIFYDYVIKGENYSKVEMINLNSRLKYLPRFRFDILLWSRIGISELF